MKIDPRPCALLLVLFAASCASDPSPDVNKAAPQGTGFVHEQVTFDGDTHNFAVFVPFNYSPSNKYATIVFLHGIGETGNDGHKNLSVGLGQAIAKNPSAFPFIAVFPQSGGSWEGSGHDDLVINALHEAESHYSIDPNRIILTGLSTGGYGTWLIGAKHPDVFAGLVPMCAYDDYPDVPTLAKMHVWAFHNAADPFVFSSGTKEMIDRLQKAGGDAKFTEYDDFGHDCWSKAYDDPELFNWMLQQHLH
jgi:predicted peptidase